MGTLSKALGLSGGYLAASREVIDVLINRARSFIYSTAPPPCLAHAAGEMLKVIAGEEGEKRRQRLRGHVETLRRHLGAPEHPAAILPVILGGESEAMQASKSLFEAGFLVPAIRYPTVARGQARLRITLSAGHSDEQILNFGADLNPHVSKKS
jgi:7-keto-8-aminopelargonate synthetase-like enzyme